MIFCTGHNSTSSYFLWLAKEAGAGFGRFSLEALEELRAV